MTGAVHASVYAMRYSMNLFSNSTYFLDDPERGDQFEQRDRRKVAGLTTSRLWNGSLGARPMTNELGLQVRQDRIEVGLYDTVARERVATTRDDRVNQSSYGFYWENGIQWQERLRSVAGLRADHHRFRIDADLPQNSGRQRDSLVSPKLSLIAGPWARTEAFVNWGRGFHSNDARGTVTRFDLKCLRSAPADECAVSPVPGLVRSTGYEVGLRTEALRGLQSSLSLWILDIGSELRRGRRHDRAQPTEPAPWGRVQQSLHTRPMAGIRPRPRLEPLPFHRRRPGRWILGAVSRVGSLAMTVRDAGPWSRTFALRHLGARPLVEDRSVVARAFTLASLRVGYRFNRHVETFLDVFNLFDRRVDDIEYYYDSRLRGEATGTSDRHFHPVEPRMVRLSLKVAL